MFPCVHPWQDEVIENFSKTKDKKTANKSRLEKLTLQVALDVALECADPALPGLGPADFLLVVGLSGL